VNKDLNTGDRFDYTITPENHFSIAYHAKIWIFSHFLFNLLLLMQFGIPAAGMIRFFEKDQDKAM
jgi:hypothetical protein